MSWILFAILAASAPTKPSPPPPVPEADKAAEDFKRDLIEFVRGHDHLVDVTVVLRGADGSGRIMTVAQDQFDATPIYQAAIRILTTALEEQSQVTREVFPLRAVVPESPSYRL